MAYISTQDIWKTESEIRNQWLNCGKVSMKQQNIESSWGVSYKCEGLKHLNIWHSGTESYEICDPQFGEQ
jgi:hypothetical protein